jgi:hypothetical protein
MKLTSLLLGITATALISCDRHSFDETKVLHEEHGSSHKEAESSDHHVSEKAVDLHKEEKSHH